MPPTISLRFIGLFCLALVLPATTQAADEAEPAPLVISQDHAWPPMAFRDRYGEPRGLLVDLWRALGEQMGRPVEFRLADWPQTIEQVRDGRAEAHGGLFASPERAKILAFSRPLLPLETVLFVSADAQTRAVDDPALAPIGVVAGSYEREFLLDRYPDLRIREYANNDKLVTAAVAGQVSAFAVDYPVGRYLLDRYSTPGRFHVLKVLYRQQLVAAVRPGNSALLKTLNDAIGELDPEELERISNRWTHTEIIEITPRWLLPVLTASSALLVLLFMAIYLRALRQQRNQLTRQLHEQTRDLKERGEQFRALFDNAAISVMVHDKDTAEVLQANTRALESYGVADVDELNRIAFESVSSWAEAPYTLKDARQRFAEVREQGARRFEWLTRRIDGESIWEDVFLQLVQVGGKERIVSTSIDITARKRAEAGLEQQLQLEERVREVSLLLLSPGSGTTQGNTVLALGRLGDFLQSSRCILFDYDTSHGSLNLHLQWCAPGIAPRATDFHIPAVVVTPYYPTLLQGEAVIVNAGDDNLHVLEHALLDEGGDRSVLVLPILRDATLEGVLIFSFADQQAHWPKSYLKLLHVATELISGALVRQYLADELERQATHDNLTEFYNRHKFEEQLYQELERTNRYQRRFTVILLDIDHFKSVNDRYGHDVGDAVLQQLADTIRQQLRDTDIPARWGGEEFIVLLPETGADGAWQAAENLRERIASTDFPGVGQVTVSIGVTSYRPGDTLDSLFKRADEALYQAKEAGRNRVRPGPDPAVQGLDPGH